MACASLRLILAGCAATLLAAPSAQAATYYWDSNGTGTPGAGATPNGTWGLDSFWSTDSTGANIGTPVLTATTTSADNVFFSAGTDAVNPYAISLNSATQNAKLVTFKNGTVTLSNGTLGLGNGGGITVASTAVTGATIGSNLTISGGQSFNVAASMALALNTGTFTRNAGSTLNVLSTGTVTTTMTGLSTGSLVNGIIGPWASFGSGASTKYATIDGSNNIVGLDGTAAATAANVTSTAGTFNYDVGAQGTLGASASVNTLRYTGTTVAAPTMSISTAFTTNGIMNAGVTSGLGLTISGAKVTSGTGEMVINAASGDIFFTSSSGINNSGNLVTFNVASGRSVIGSSGGANISGSGGVTKLGAGTLSFRFASAYSGPTTISEGTISAFSAGVLGDGSATNTLIFNGGTLQYDEATSSAPFVSPTTRSGTITSNGGTINTRNKSMSFAGNIAGAGGLTKMDNSGAIGILILSGTNNYGGGTTITGGIMQFAKIAAMPATGNVTVAPASGAIAATLAVNAGAASGEWTNGTTATNGSIGGLLAGLGGQAGSTVTYVGNVNLGIDTTNATAATMTYSGVVGNVGTTLGLTKLGTGTLVLDQSNTYAGKTTILGGGTLSINSIKNVSGGASAVGNPTTTANGTIDIGSTTTAATLRYVGSGDTTNRVINMAGTTFGSTLDASGSGALVFSSAVTATGGGIKTLTLTGSSTAANSIAAIPNSTGTTSVNKTGNGTWRMTGSSSFTGQLTVTQGTIVAAVGTGPSGSGVFGQAVSPSLLPQVGDSGAGASGFAAMLLEDGVVLNRSLQVAALGSGATQLAILGGANTSGTSTFAYNTEIRIGRGVSLQAATGGTVDFGNVWLDSTGSASPAFSYAVGTAGNLGTVRLSNPLATTSGSVSINYGTLLFGTDNQVASSTPVSIGSSGGNGTLNLDGNSLALSRLNFNGAGSFGGTVANSGAGTLTMQDGIAAALIQVNSGTAHAINSAIAMANATTVSVASNAQIAINRAISGAFGLTKIGSGALTLSGSSLFSGATTVSAGTLVVNGSLASTAGLNVDSGAFLGGSGSLASTIAGAGLVGPGTSPGILTALAVNPSAGTDFSFELTGTGAPAWSVASASVNDVLHLTSTSPFTSPLNSSNAVNIYFQVASLAAGDTFQGGFFTDATLAQSNLLTNVSAGQFNYFVQGDGSGTSVYNDVHYYTLSDYIARPGIGITGVTMSTQTVASANFATGPVTNGQVVELVIVPEPDTIIFAGIGIGMAAWSIWKRRRIAQIMRTK